MISYKKLLYKENSIEYKEEEAASSNSLLAINEFDNQPNRYDSIIEITEQVHDKKGSEDKSLFAKFEKVEEEPLIGDNKEDYDKKDNESQDNNDINVDDY